MCVRAPDGQPEKPDDPVRPIEIGVPRRVPLDQTRRGMYPTTRLSDALTAICASAGKIGDAREEGIDAHAAQRLPRRSCGASGNICARSSAQENKPPPKMTFMPFRKYFSTQIQYLHDVVSL